MDSWAHRGFDEWGFWESAETGAYWLYGPLRVFELVAQSYSLHGFAETLYRQCWKPGHLNSLLPILDFGLWTYLPAPMPWLTHPLPDAWNDSDSEGGLSLSSCSQVWFLLTLCSSLLSTFQFVMAPWGTCKAAWRSTFELWLCVDYVWLWLKYICIHHQNASHCGKRPQD
jgi:hypothetical protein